MQFANAGHPYPLLYKKETGEIIDLLPSKDVPQYGAIGIKDVEVSFVDTSFQMQSGDMLFCFTDGITEMRNAQNQDLGVLLLPFQAISIPRAFPVLKTRYYRKVSRHNVPLEQQVP